MVLPKYACCRPVWRTKTHYCCILCIKYTNKKIIAEQYDNAAVRTVVKVSSSACKYCKKKMITRQQYGSAVVRTVVKDRGVQQWGRWYSQAPPVGGRYFRNKKKFISHRTQKDFHVQNGPPTHHGRRRVPSTYPPTKPVLHTAEQQCSSTYIRTTVVQQYVQQYT